MKYHFLALIVLLFGTRGYAQTRIKVQNPVNDISQFDEFRKELRSFQMFELQTDQAKALLVPQPKNPSLVLELANGERLEMVLEPSSIKSDGYQVTIYTDQGYQQAQPNQIYTYKGYLKGNSESKVRLTVTAEEFSGVIQNFQGDNLHFQTHKLQTQQQALVIYQDSDLLQPNTHKCGNPNKSKSANGSGNRSSGLNADCLVTEIYLIADAAAVDAFGGTPASAEANMLEILNLVNSHYEPVGIKYEVAGVFISTNPNGPWQIRNEADEQLDAAIEWFNNQNFPGDVFTFWSDPDWDYSYAYLGVICGYYGGNLCAAWGGLTANTLNSNTQSHELGHNFDAGHDGSGIMRSTVTNQPSSFSSNSISVMTNYIPSVENVCLDPCVDDCSNFIADAGSDQTICLGETTQLQASGGSSYSWSPVTGLDNPDISNPMANPSATTTYTVTVSNNSGCSGQAQVTITVQDLPTADAGDDQVLSCTVGSVTLDGSGSADGPDINYLWSTVDGNIVSGGTSASPVVDASGTYVLSVVDQNTGCQADDQVVVTNDASLPVADAGADQALTCLVNTLDLDGTNSSQGANYTYLWSTNDGNILSGADTDQATVDAPGSYTLTITETGSGCTSFDQVQVVSDTATPIADAGADQILGCGASSLSIGGGNTSAGAEFSYQWSTADGNIDGDAQSSTAQVTSAGTYELLVTNNMNGCSQSDAVVVAEDTTLPVVTAGGDQILNCQVSQMTLDGSGSATGANISYLWSTSNGNIVSGETTLSVVIDLPGDYLLTVRNELTGCEDSDVATVSLSAAPPIADGGEDQELTCAVTSVSLDGSGSSSGANISYQWIAVSGNIVSGATTNNPLVDSEGTYRLTVTDNGTGCESTDEVVVRSNADVPRADAGRDLIIGCNSPTVDVRGDNSSAGTQYSYSWTTTDGSIVGGQNTPILTVNDAGTYTLTVTNTNTGCSSSDEAVVILDNTLPSVDAGSDQVINCQVPQVQLDGTNSDQGNEFSYRWTTTDGNIVGGGSSQTAIVDLAGTYQFTVTNTNSGCSQSDEVVVTGNTLAPQADAGTNKVLSCQNPTAQLGNATSATSNIVYQWNTNDGNILSGANSSQITVDLAGTYVLTVTNTDNNCSSQDQVLVSGSSTPPTVDAGEDVVITSGEQIQLQAETGSNVSYQWSPAEAVSNPNIANPTVTPEQTLTLTVTVVDGNNCVAEDQVTITVPVVEDLVIPNSFSPNGDGVNDTWNIPGIEYLGTYTLEVFNRLGNSVHRGSSIRWDGTYRGEVLPTGTYYYILNFTDQGSLAGHVNIIK